MLEIYNESVYDLLNATGEDLDLHLKPRSEEVYVKGLSWEEVNTGRLSLAVSAAEKDAMMRCCAAGCTFSWTLAS